MVSLINFKTFDEDLSESQIVSDQCAGGGSAPPVDRRLYSSSPAGANQASQNDPSATQRQRPETAMSYAQDEDFGSNTSGKFQADARRQEHYSYAGKPKESGAAGKQQVAVAGAGCSASSFTVTWRKLKFCIEPKWHEKIANGPAALMALASRVSASSTSSKGASPAAASSSLAMATTPLPPPASAKTATTAPEESARSSAQAAPIATTTTTTTTTTSDRVVLDQLDGSFKSGELTAILGPSGAGKTTLLDCLTGHRKSGLSGSIRFSLTSSSQASGALAPGGHPNRESDCQLASFIHRDQAAAEAHATHKQKNLILAQSGFARQPFAGRLDRKPPAAAPLAAFSETMNGDNLKVSIIPQNDHLIGHLTVYETLNYASKMKNCFEGQFDHKLNIGRVAQQLGLMSCLGTRINKLSGGQYKRVSIAQELLSSPDVLILDEPTSGLDAMTCYQTVQVLKKLTDDCRASGQKSIAVILTIHQPNSDVFQQFNHVYVVAQGGKCIYEGPPGSIESVINRVGICLPNSYYNPATMIVEIAAGKFGQEAICKLNAIQRKQYGEGALIVDEQNSTGDSAVDCPSSNYEDDEDEPDLPDRREPATERGKINVGFSMEGEPDVRDSNNNNNNGEDEPKCTLDRLAADEMVACPCESTGRRPSDIKLPTGSDHLEVVAASFSEKQQDRRKKRRRTRRRASEMAVTNDADGVRARSILKTPVSAVRILMGAGGNGGGGGGDGDSGDGTGSDAGFGGRSEKRLKLNSLKADQKFPFWRHTYLHFHRSWLSIVRDPMLCSMQLALHIIVPVMVSLVYGTYVGKPNACPRAGPIDIMAYALEPTDTALQLQEDLRTTLENIGYIFFKLYGIIFAAMTVTVLTFPLDMHVLVKEFRNGWYGLASYFLGRTLADIPFQLTLPLLAMALSYYATGQPYSYLQWRFFSITAILILSSLIAQSQGLLFGAILMDKMKAAVFVAPAATTPIILFAGFLVRIQSIPSYLRPLSNLSYLRYAIEACLISRYGFNQCECDPAIFNQTVRELPPIARSMLDYWLSSYTTTPEPTSLAGNGTELEQLLPEAAGNDTAASKPDLFTKLIDSLARANSFGRNITSCEQVVPYPMIDYDLKDEQLFSCFAILLAMLVFTRLLTFFIVCYKVKRKV